MENITQIGDAPLTRRQAREIERRTGVRPIAGATSSAISAFTKDADQIADVAQSVKDTGKIERNDVASLVSVVPTELIAKVAAPISIADAVDSAEHDEARGLTIRAAVPAALIAQRRRRTAGSFAAAASFTALAAAGISSMGGQGVDIAAADHQASLVSQVNRSMDTANESTQVTNAKVDAQALKAEAQTLKPVAAFDAASVQTAVAEDAPVVATPASGDGDDSSAPAVDGGAQPSSVSVAPAGDLQSTIVAGAMAQIGTPGLDCTDMVQNALAAAGLTTSRFDGGPDLGVESFYAFGSVIPASEAQPGDLMIADGIHVAIYIGNGQAVHGGWNGDADDTVIAGVDTYGYNYVRVHG